MRIIVFILLLAFFTDSARAQEKRRSWTAKLNTGAFIGITNISIEKAFCKRHSFTLAPSYGFFRSEQFTYETSGVGGEYRYYFSKKYLAPQGWYAAAGGNYAHGKANIETKNESYTVNGFALKMDGGKQWILKKGWTLDANVGLQYLKLHVKGVDYEATYKWWLPALGVGIGYAF